MVDCMLNMTTLASKESSATVSSRHRPMAMKETSFLSLFLKYR